MFEYPLPHNDELKPLRPHKTNKILEEKIRYLFSHIKFPYYKLYIDVSTSGKRALTRDMANIAVACTRYFIEHPQQYNHSFETIHMSILVKMWKQTFNHCRMQRKEIDKYYATKTVLLGIENGLFDELIRTCFDKDYKYADDLVKHRATISALTNEQVGLRDKVSYGTHEHGATFEYLASLD